VLEGAEDVLDSLVHREQRFEPAAIPSGDVRDRGRAEGRKVADAAGLVGDVLLVERGRLRQRLVREVAAVARWRLGGRGAGPGLVRATGVVRGVRRYVEEERSLRRRALANEVDGLAREDIGLVIVLPILDDVPV